MPVRVDADPRFLDQREFGEIAFEVMNHVFAIHNEMGRFLDEDIYRNAIAARVGVDAQTEVMIEVVFEEFRKLYYLDLLVDGGAVFELKAVKGLGAAHRSQLLNYLLLCGLSHGKLVNLRGEKVEHEFVNTQLRHADRTAFEVVDHDWSDPAPTDRSLREWMLEFLREMGAGLDVQLYESAIGHFLGGEDAVAGEIDVLLDGRCMGRQKMLMATPKWAFKTTTMAAVEMSHFADHLQRFLRHTNLDGIHWINITRSLVTFRSIRKSGQKN